MPLAGMIRLLLCVALLLIGSQVAGAGEPTSERTLNLIKTISYSSFFGGELNGKCRIDRKAWDTAIQFVANQSTRLKIVTFDELVAELDRMQKRGSDEVSSRYAGTPQLHLNLIVIEMPSGCAAVLNTRLIAAAHPTRLVATDQTVYLPFLELWSDMR
jgi:hypothetical protein